ncbi:MAG TPA: winged helix-turn-helix domain-containing protein [Nitrososphaeraceae archaeon]
MKSLATRDYLSILLDDASLRIMKLLEEKEITIQQVATILDLPLSSTYRKMSKLEDLDIIKKTKILRRMDGLDEAFYTLWIYEISISYKNKKLVYNAKHKPLEDKIARLWQKFKG